MLFKKHSPKKNHRCSNHHRRGIIIILRNILRVPLLLFLLVIGTLWQFVGLWVADTSSSSSSLSSSSDHRDGTGITNALAKSTTSTGIKNGNSDYQQATTLPLLQQHPGIIPKVLSQQGQQLEITTHNNNNNHRKNTHNVTIVSRVPRPYRENAIVYLVQKNHTTYHRNSYELLMQSLDLLYQNYLSQNNGQNADTVDIYLFHTGDFELDDLDILEPIVLGTTSRSSSSSSSSSGMGGSSNTNTTNKKNNNTGILKLVNLVGTSYWQLPHNVRQDNPSTDWLDYSLFPVGYRHMCRFFGIQLWNLFHTLNTQQQLQQHQNDDNISSSSSSSSCCNYRYIWRLDEDSFIHSPITYNIFHHMEVNHYVYGYRLCSYELTWNKFVPQWFHKWHTTKIKPIRSIDWELCGFYNNFFIADLNFFRSKKVQTFLHEIDRRGFIYRKRYGDLVIHSMAVYAFAQPNQIHRFLDFTYEHVTIDKRIGQQQNGCVIWGAIQSGYLDLNADTILKQYQEKYYLLGTNNLMKKNCTSSSSIINQLNFTDLSPTYSHLPEKLQQTIQLGTISAGKVEMINKGILSG